MSHNLRYNSGQGQMNRLANIAFGYNDQYSAEQVLQLLLQRETREAYLKAQAEANMTPAQREAKLKRREEINAKAAATRKANKDKLLVATVQPPVQPPLAQMDIAPPYVQVQTISTHLPAVLVQQIAEAPPSAQMPSISIAPPAVPGTLHETDESEEEPSETDTKDAEDIWNAHTSVKHKGEKEAKKTDKKYKKSSRVKLQKLMIKQVKSMAQERQQLVTAQPVLDLSSTDLTRLTKASTTLHKNGFEKFNVDVDTVVPIGSLVCLKVTEFTFMQNYCVTRAFIFIFIYKDFMRTGCSRINGATFKRRFHSQTSPNIQCCCV